MRSHGVVLEPMAVCPFRERMPIPLSGFSTAAFA